MAQLTAQTAINPLLRDYGFAVETAAAETELLLAAEEAGIEITDDLREAIRRLAEEYGAAAAAADELADKQEETRDGAQKFRDLERDVFRGFIEDVNDGTSALDALHRALTKIQDKLLDIGLDRIFGTGGGGKTSILGSLVGSLLGGAGGGGGFVPPVGASLSGGPFAKGAAFSGGNVVPFAHGGIVSNPTVFPMKNRIGLLGEAGPEAILPLKRGPGGKLGVEATGGRGGLTININQPIDARGAVEGTAAQIQRALADNNQRLPILIRDAQARGK